MEVRRKYPGFSSPSCARSIVKEGGFTLGKPHLAMIEEGREFVTDADSTAALKQAAPGLTNGIEPGK